MAFIGGSIESVSIAGVEYAVASDAGAEINIGGFVTTRESNGNSTDRKILTRNSWKVTGLSLSIDFAAGGLEFLQDLADRKGDEDFVLTLVDGTIYQGVGSPMDEILGNTQNATAAVSFSGPGKLTRQ